MPFDPFRDWVVEISSTTGVGSYTLGGAPPGTGWRTFRDEYADGAATVCFCVRGADKLKLEKNQLTTLTYGVSPGTDTLTRNVIASTTGAPINWQPSDLPLTIFVAPDAAAANIAVTGAIAEDKDDIPLLLFGDWHKADDIAAPEVIEKRLRDNGTTDDGILLGKFNRTARKYVPDPDAINFGPGYIQGLTYANSSGDAANDIEFHAGRCADSTGVYPLILAAAMTKRLDATWAAGDGNGGLRSGLSIANTDYYGHLIGNSATGDIDAMFDTSFAAPVLPSGYDYFRPVAWFRRSGGSILAFKAYEISGGGIDFQWDAKPTDISLSGQTFTTRRTDALSAPTAFSTEAHVRAAMTHPSGAGTVHVTLSNPEVASDDDITLTLQADGIQISGEVWTRLSAAGLLGSKSNTASLGGYTVRTHGFKWSRR